MIRERDVPPLQNWESLLENRVPLPPVLDFTSSII